MCCSVLVSVDTRNVAYTEYNQLKLNSPQTNLDHETETDEDLKLKCKLQWLTTVHE